MTNVIGLVLPFFGLIFIGFLVARIHREPVEALGWMNIFIIYVALPALFFQLLARTPFEELTEWRFVAGSLFSTLLIFSVMFAGSLVMSRGDVAESTMKGLAAAYGNTGYMGPGLALLAFGEQATVPVALIFCFENMMHFTVAPMMMALSGSDKRPLPQLLAGIVRRILLHPFIVATAAGITAAYFQFRPPVPVDRLLSYLSGAAAPCALFAMGVTLALRPLKRVPHEIAPIAVLKLIVHPLLCYAVLSRIGNFPPTWLFSAVLLAALPTATNVFVLAQQYGVWIERASASILITTCASVVTVTGLLYLIQHGILTANMVP
ncbi:AEC family transporter [Mesorhizobium sp. SP-1A]|uniref:AEC family transporter n=1 Tax=Mesorhizobium sp. SP-1A TaxID=3077840 RepID=UPI0028F6EFA7|nr:AEC family transporter [Mesorhizobium sp. SP-1A]